MRIGWGRPNGNLWTLSSSIWPWYTGRTSRSVDGRRKNKQGDRESLINSRWSASIGSCSSVLLQASDSWQQGERSCGERNPEQRAYAAPQRTLLSPDTIWGSHACGGRGDTKSSDYKWWLSHLEQQQVQASWGRNVGRDGWKTGNHDGWMDNTSGGGKKKAPTVNAPRCQYAETLPVVLTGTAANNNIISQ